MDNNNYNSLYTLPAWIEAIANEVVHYSDYETVLRNNCPLIDVDHLLARGTDLVHFVNRMIQGESDRMRAASERAFNDNDNSMDDLPGFDQGAIIEISSASSSVQTISDVSSVYETDSDYHTTSSSSSETSSSTDNNDNNSSVAINQTDMDLYYYAETWSTYLCDQETLCDPAELARRNRLDNVEHRSFYTNSTQDDNGSVHLDQDQGRLLDEMFAEIPNDIQTDSYIANWILDNNC